ncbi:hypothetical protein [uncultured Imperialibacter sp.]|uniref:hypothetical protein n=1 Tax=uncultured Imperialibacter sp. TaxID=1672639 RepID=UPI0030D79256|tara:strand:- start:9317 stop:9664 length:348 start_codon:yes stop_codon:yes gene_type:complete
MVLKVINSILILFSVYMGFKHGWGMVSADPKMLEMFGKWGISKHAIINFGAVGIFATVLILFPRTFFLGNFITAASLLLIVALCLQQRDFKTALVELPFMILPLVMIYLKHPLAK